MAGSDEAASLQACAMRVTRLAADGSTPAGSTNLIVTGAFIKVDVKGVFEAGDDISQKNACGNIALAYKDPDHFKRFDLAITMTNPNPEFAEMLVNGSLITASGNSIGLSVPAVGTAPALGVCLEVWTKAWLGGGAPPGVSVSDGVTAVSTTVTSATAAFTQADVGATISGGTIPYGATIASVTNSTTVIISAPATAVATAVPLLIGRPGAYYRHVFPYLRAAVGDFALEDAVRQVLYNGPAQENLGIGNGPSNDFPSTMITSRAYSYFRDHAPPSLGTIGYQATPVQT